MKESDGISKYKNKAIEHATGEFLIFIDPMTFTSKCFDLC